MCKSLKNIGLSLVLIACSMHGQANPTADGDSCKKDCIRLCDQQSQPNCDGKERKEHFKNFNHKFQNVQNRAVYVSNKHGKVEVKTGNQNEVMVNVRITARCQDEAAAQQIFSRINIAFSEDANQVKSETNIEAQRGWSNQNQDYSIDYEVIMPSKNDLIVLNAYGTTSIPTLTGKVRIEQKYGNFAISDAPNVQMALAYGNGAINTCGNLNGTVGYANLDVSAVKNTSLKSKYSTLNFNQTGNVEVNTAYDNIKIVKVDALKMDSRYSDLMVNIVQNLMCEAEYSDIKIMELEGNANMRTKYGGVRVARVGSNFGLMDINGNYTDFHFQMTPNTSFQLDAQGTYADFGRPGALKTNVEKSKGSVQEFHGTVGNPNTRNVMRVRLVYGDLIIK